MVGNVERFGLRKDFLDFKGRKMLRLLAVDGRNVLRCTKWWKCFVFLHDQPPRESHDS